MTRCKWVRNADGAQYCNHPALNGSITAQGRVICDPTECTWSEDAK